MATASAIEWTETTWNPVVGCTEASTGCANCYARTMSNRLAGMSKADRAKGKNPGKKSAYELTVMEDGRWSGVVQTVPAALTEPLRWKKPRRVFVNSMSDLFWGTDRDLAYARRRGVEDPKPVPFDFIDQVFAVMALCPQHTFQILTKRPERMADYLSDHGVGCSWAWATVGISNDQRLPAVTAEVAVEWTRRGLPNVHLGTSVENQAQADARIPHLLNCPAKVRFLSCEPLLGAVNLTRISNPASLHSLINALEGTNRNPMGTCSSASYPMGKRIDWVIAGGESGHQARPCNVEWIRSIVEQCGDAGVPCFVKQLGAKVIDRNDVGFDADVVSVLNEETGDWEPYSKQAWPSTVEVEHDLDGTRDGYQGAPVRVHLMDSKGGDPVEWPEDIRQRQWPGEGG